MVELRLPNIKGVTEREQLMEIKAYLYQLTEQLQFALNSIDNTSSSQVVANIPRVSSAVSVASTGQGTQATFNSIKSFIIKSAEIVDAYYEEINRRLEGVYVAQSDFGGFAEKTSQDIEETSTSTTQSFENLQMIINDANGRIADVDGDLQASKEVINDSIQGVQGSITGVNALLEDAKAQLQGGLDDLEVKVDVLKAGIDVGDEVVVVGVTATIRSGLLYTTDGGIPVYGIEIGQSVKDEVAGTEVFNKYARFTSEKLSFYDSNGYEVAYISDKKLFIKMAEITVSFKIGGFIDLVMASGDVVTKWGGG